MALTQNPLYPVSIPNMYCKHIANATLRSRIETVCRAAGYEPPVICTPLELVEE